MHPVELAQWLKSNQAVEQLGPAIRALIDDHIRRFRRPPTLDIVHAWTFMRLLEEVQAMPASRGKDWILGQWQRVMWPRFRDELHSPRSPMAWQSIRFLAWALAAEIERVCHPRITPEGFLAWLRGEGADVELHHAWACCAEDNPDFLKACWCEDTELRLMREVFIGRITEGVRCLSLFYLPDIVRWLAFLQAPTTAVEALQVARAQTDEPPLFVSYRVPLMLCWLADQLEALLDTPADECISDQAEEDGSSATDASGPG